MYKTVIRITIAGALCVAAGSALAQGNSAARVAVTGAAASGNIAVPSLSALNRPIAVPVTRASADLVAGTAFGRIGAAPGLYDAKPGQAGISPDWEKTSKDSDASRKSEAASQSAGLQHKQLHQIPTCN